LVRFGHTEPFFRVLWSSISLSSPPTRCTIPFFWSLHPMLLPISFADRDCPSICAVICEEECYGSEAPQNMESRP
jgi:hypothetical protein